MFTYPIIGPKAGESGSNDPLILWDSTPLTTTYFEPQNAAYFNLYFYENRPAGYYLAEPGNWTTGVATLDFANMPPWYEMSTGEYLVKWEVVEVVSGDETGPYSSTTAEGVWGDAFRYNISFQDVNYDDIPTHIVLDITLAKDNGSGSPVAGTESTKRVTFIGNGNATNYLQDTFSNTTKTPLTSSAFEYSRGLATGAAWIQDAGDIEVDGSGNAQAVQNGGANTDNRYVADSGMSDCTIYIDIEINNNDTNGSGIVFRRQDSSNYWLLKLDTPLTSPTLKIIEVNSGVETVRASETVDLYGSADLSGLGRKTEMRVQLNGSKIRGQILSYYVIDSNYDRLEEKMVTTVDYTSSSMQSETHHGIYLGNEAAEIGAINVFDSEIGYIF